MLNFIKKSAFWGAFAAVMASIFVLGVYLGYGNRPAVEKIIGISHKQPVSISESGLNFEPFWKAWGIIEDKYVGTDGLARQNMLLGAISGLVASLGDPYSVFFPPKEAEVFESNVEGDFEGVGMEIGIRNNVLTVVAPLKGTPAERAGIKSGDQILKIDDRITSDISVDKAVQLIRGERGTVVKLTIARKGENEPLEIEVTRDKIEIPVLDIKQKPDGVFVIELYNFSGRSAFAFRDALRQMINSGSDKLIVDLRGNPGGYLEAAVDLSSWFLPMGDIVVREKFSEGEEQVYRSKGYDVFKNLSLAILVDGGSASASEIFAGALRDHGVAKLVGEKTFGKGSVQELIDVGGSGSLKLTIARWLTPNGESISEKGLEPDVVVGFTKEDFNAGRDPQMERAIELLTK